MSDGNAKFRKKIICSLEVVFDLCENEFMEIARDGNAFSE